MFNFPLVLFQWMFHDSVRNNHTLFLSTFLILLWITHYCFISIYFATDIVSHACTIFERKCCCCLERRTPFLERKCGAYPSSYPRTVGIYNGRTAEARGCQRWRLVEGHTLFRTFYPSLNLAVFFRFHLLCNCLYFISCLHTFRTKELQSSRSTLIRPEKLGLVHPFLSSQSRV